MSEYAKLLWMDLEMTGLDPIKDRILEVAVIATDWDCNEIATYQAVVKVDENLIQTRMVGEFWEKYTLIKAALIEQNATGNSGDAVENELLAFIEKHFAANERVVLAGNSIHQDRKFIEQAWHRLNARLHYRMLDVSAWKIVFNGKYKKMFTKPEVHRAMDDIRGSIQELNYYLGKVKA